MAWLIAYGVLLNIVPALAIAHAGGLLTRRGGKHRRTGTNPGSES